MSAQPGTVTIEHKGRRYHGNYHVSGKIITVTCNGFTKTSQAGGLPPEVLAKMMLQELAAEGKI